MCTKTSLLGMKDISGMNRKSQFIELPVDILWNVFIKCSPQALGRLSQTCRYFLEIISDDLLWRHLCWRDFNLKDPELGQFQFYSSLYKKLLHKYGWMLGTYLSSICGMGGLAEIRYRDGMVEGVHWEPIDEGTSLVEIMVFQIRWVAKQLVTLCLPLESVETHHECLIAFDKYRGILLLDCKDEDKHSKIMSDARNQGLVKKPYSDLSSFQMRNSLLFYCIEMGLHFYPALLPDSKGIPNGLRIAEKFAIPLVTPGLFKGCMPMNNVIGAQLISLCYKDENEIHGMMVSGDITGSAKKNTFLKVFLKQPLSPFVEEQQSYDALLNSPRKPSSLSNGQAQRFILPEGCKTKITLPRTCLARYNGFVRVQHGPSYWQAHFIVFSEDFVGILPLENIRSIWTFRKVRQDFTRNILTHVGSAI